MCVLPVELETVPECLPCALCGARAPEVCDICGDRICQAEACQRIHEHTRPMCECGRPDDGHDHRAWCDGCGELLVMRRRFPPLECARCTPSPARLEAGC